MIAIRNQEGPGYFIARFLLFLTLTTSYLHLSFFYTNINHLF